VDTIELTIPVDKSEHEVLIARLEEFGFNGFQQDERHLKAYISAEDWSPGKSGYVTSWLQKRGLDGPVEEQVLEDRDWNALWEQSIEPRTVGPFLIKPTWASTPPDTEAKHVLQIDPRMSFGTGYHESTRLMLRLMTEYVGAGDLVLDAGSGTGILSVAAVRLGAERVIAFDIEAWAETNAHDTMRRNDVADRVDVRRGTIDVVPETGFDVILANINRGVLVELLPDFAERIAPDGHLILSGVLLEDQMRMRDAASEHGFRVVDHAAENDWWAGVLQRADVSLDGFPT
jgi:ribosomal protein L11 methyltransferase